MSSKDLPAGWPSSREPRAALAPTWPTLFAEGGAKVVLFDLDKAVSDTAKEIADKNGVEAWGAVVDITDAKATEAAINEAAERFGGIHMLVNNAGITRDNLLHKMTEEDWDQVMAVHLKGNFLCTKYAQKFMVQQRFGKIVSLSSTAALGNRGQFNYSAAKAAIQGMTRTLSIELGPFNINVNCVAPGFVDTEMTRKTARRLGQDPEEYKAARAKAIPLGASACRATSPTSSASCAARKPPTFRARSSMSAAGRRRGARP